MKQVIVYGPGCTQCLLAEAVVRRAIAELGVAAEVTTVSDLRAIMQARIPGTPAVSVDGELKLAGRLPSLQEVMAWMG